MGGKTTVDIGSANQHFKKRYVFFFFFLNLLWNVVPDGQDGKIHDKELIGRKTFFKCSDRVLDTNCSVYSG